MDDRARPAMPRAVKEPALEALRNKLAVVISKAEVAQLAAEHPEVRTRLACVLKAAWEAEAILADPTGHGDPLGLDRPGLGQYDEEPE